jgi:predicted dehydrogenase
MHILFLGYSNLFKNRLLPILDQLQEITKVSLAKYKQQVWDNEFLNSKREIQLFDNYEDAIKNSNADLVYISTVNSSHFELASRCITQNFHVIIDKPATTNLSQTKELIRMAHKKDRLLAESIVYLYHPQFSIIKEIIENEKLIPKFLTLFFSFPPLNIDNFRYNKKLGGGAILDTGSYAVSPARFFFNDLPLKSFCNINSRNDEVETSYSVLVNYSKGRSMIGHFGFTTEYINRMNILGENFSIDVDRVFTIPENIENLIVFKKENSVKKIYAPKGNSFVIFLKNVIDSIHLNNFQRFSEYMLMDATSLETLRKSI